jgi:hypothetical protein
MLITLALQDYLFKTSFDQQEHLNVSCWSQLDCFEN